MIGSRKVEVIELMIGCRMVEVIELMIGLALRTSDLHHGTRCLNNPACSSYRLRSKGQV